MGIRVHRQESTSARRAYSIRIRIKNTLCHEKREKWDLIEHIPLE